MVVQLLLARVEHSTHSWIEEEYAQPPLQTPVPNIQVLLLHVHPTAVQLLAVKYWQPMLVPREMRLSMMASVMSMLRDFMVCCKEKFLINYYYFTFATASLLGLAGISKRTMPQGPNNYGSACGHIFLKQQKQKRLHDKL
jgi:hypothetical protein